MREREREWMRGGEGRKVCHEKGGEGEENE